MSEEQPITAEALGEELYEHLQISKLQAENSALHSQVDTLTKERRAATMALEKIKLLTVTCGAPGEPTTADALSKMLRICIDAGVTKGLSELRGAVDR